MSEKAIYLPNYYADRMILQQNVQLRIPGVAAAEKEIHLKLFRQPSDGHMVTDLEKQYGLIYEDVDNTDRRGRFEFRLPKLEASLDTYSIVIRCGEDSVRLEDILVGEIWLAAGSDNMAMPVSSTDVADRLDLTATQDHIRFFTMASTGLGEDNLQYSYYPVGYIADGKWQRGSYPNEMANVSAVAYAFALKLEEALHIPIGIYDLACPGTYLHSWLPREVIEQDAYLKNHAREVHMYRDKDNWNSANPEKRKNRFDSDDAGSATDNPLVARRTVMKRNVFSPESRLFQQKNQPLQ